jgi:hypothetical protein
MSTGSIFCAFLDGKYPAKKVAINEKTIPMM